MRTTHSPAAAGRALRAGLSLLVLAGAVAGLPLLLAWATPAIWASSHDDLTHLLDRQDTGAAFLLLLIAVGWIGWAQFTFCAIRELIAQLRGRTWHAPHGLGSSQRAAALLIGSILVLLPTSSALASDAHAAPSAALARLPGQSHAPQAADAGQDATRAGTRHRAYTVRETRPAESLWAIAERQLGDGERWREIADLNEGRTMVDGQVFRANSFLQPGWQLQMPDAGEVAGDLRTQLGAGAAPVGDEKIEHTVTVRVRRLPVEDRRGGARRRQRLASAFRRQPRQAAAGRPARYHRPGPDPPRAAGHCARQPARTAAPGPRVGW